MMTDEEGKDRRICPSLSPQRHQKLIISDIGNTTLKNAENRDMRDRRAREQSIQLPSFLNFFPVPNTHLKQRARK